MARCAISIITEAHPDLMFLSSNWKQRVRPAQFRLVVMALLLLACGVLFWVVHRVCVTLRLTQLSRPPRKKNKGKLLFHFVPRVSHFERPVEWFRLCKFHVR